MTEPQLLIVDDEKEILETLRRHFELEKIPCMTASTPEEALKLHEQHVFPVVLSDIRMPGMDGMQLLQKIKKISPITMLFFMTGYATMSNMVSCLELGASDYFLKPFEKIDYLIETIRTALHRHERWKRELRLIRKNKAV